jgi:hypothetical protein
MKKLVSFITLFILGSVGYAQQLELEELTSPATPAFTLLGLSPTNISSPGLSKPFLMSLANGLNGKSIASDVAIEASPYWWSSRPGLTYKEYYGLATENRAANCLDQLARTFAFSIATSDASPGIDSLDSRNLAGGMRFQVLNGKPSRKFAQAYDETLQNDKLLKREAISNLKFKVSKNIIASNENLQQGILASVEAILATNEKFKGLPEQDRKVLQTKAVAYIQNFMKALGGADFDKEAILTLLEKERGNLTDEVNEILVEMHGMSRVGWLLEFSGAASLLAPTNKIDYTYGQDWAAWGTLTYRFDPEEGSKKMNDFNLMMRLGSNFQHSGSYNRDLGLSWVSIGDKHSLSLEGILRSYLSYKDITGIDGKVYKVSETDNTWRFALAYQYKFSEAINISLTAGKDFENATISAGGLFTLLNLNLVLPSQQGILLK